MARVIISGLPQLKKKLADYSKKVQEEVKNQVQDSGTQIESDAIANSPRQLLIKGQKSQPETLDFHQRIDNTVLNGGFGAEIGVQSENNLAIYVEFGTGEDAASYVPTLPKEIQDYARLFYVNGKGRILHQPFLIPAFRKESPIFISELKKILKNNA